LYNFNSVQLTFNQCVFNRIQYRTEHNLYSTRLDNSTDNSTDYSTDNSTETRLNYSVLTTRLTVWQFDWQFSFTSLRFGLTIPLTSSLTIRLYNSAYNSALQFSFTIQFTISTYNFVLTNSYLQFGSQLAVQFWLTKMGETIRASEQRLYRGPKRVSRVEAFAGGR